MFVVNEDKSIYLTRGDTVFFGVTADDEGSKYVFQPGEEVRFKVFEKKKCENVAFQKDFTVTEETDMVGILLTEEETKIGDVISKPVDYWYEVELNPNTYPQTLVGYDEDGAKIFRLYPEGRDIEPKPEQPCVHEEALADLLSGSIRHLVVPESCETMIPLLNNANGLSAFANLYSISMPNVKAIPETMFNACNQLTTAEFPSATFIGKSAFAGCSSLKSIVIPDTVTEIGTGAPYPTGNVFGMCTSLETAVIGKNLGQIIGGAFFSCTNLKTVTFRGKTRLQKSGGYYAFVGCTALTDIYVPWSEGEIEGAPWGAENATVHYNHK